jgi:hypothetical protein
MFGINIDREGQVALHDQVAAELRRAIAEGEDGSGERGPWRRTSLQCSE